MSLLLDLAYLAAGIVAAPLLLRKRLRTGKYRSDLPARFGFGIEPLPKSALGTRTLLLHCVSVGELNSVQTLISQLLAADQNLRIILTTGTDTGTDRARKLYGEGASSAHGRVFPVRFPFDFSYAVERLFDRVEPDAVALVELETWPNFIDIAHDRRIPVAIINGRISERSHPRYCLIRPVMASMLRQITWIGAQTNTIAQRFISLGAARESVEVVPTLKYDNAQVADHVPGQEALAAAMGVAPAHRLLVAGSTGPGEEGAILECYMKLRKEHPELRLAMAPRHPEVVPQVVAAIEDARLEPVLRTRRSDGVCSENGTATWDGGQVFVLDTMGELRKLYALAFAVFVGRSLLKKGGGGSDMIEVAALKKPCCFGKYTANFAEVVELLTAHGGAMEVADEEGLMRVVEEWLKNPARAAEMGAEAQYLIRQQQAARATAFYVEKLQWLIRDSRK